MKKLLVSIWVVRAIRAEVRRLGTWPAAFLVAALGVVALNVAGWVGVLTAP